jgi:sulfite oxidase
MTSRRNFLKTVSLGMVAASIARPSLSGASDAASQSVAGKEGMILRSFRFLDLEAPPEFLTNWITPVPHFFVRNHMFEPTTLEPSDWRLSIGGEVEKTLSLSLDDLAKLESHSVINTLECAGNGRAFYNPRLPGIQWQKGAVGNARFSGPRLRELLDRAGVKSSGKHVMFRGLDEVPGKVPPFIRSIPIEKARDPDTLVATEMNGMPLNKHHGFPARALVPGWIGAASCKWLTEIKVLDKEFEGNFMKPGYRFPNQPVAPGGSVNPDDTHPVTALNVKSIISAPSDGTTIRNRFLQIQGVAWAGEANIAKVEVSTDSGTTWRPAELGRQQARYAWRTWIYVARGLKPGEHTILSRATDSQGRVQPEVASWNPSGYIYNAIDRVKINVKA